jgi:hypothetical protein
VPWQTNQFADLEGVLSDYELSTQHKDQIRALLKAHYAFQDILMASLNLLLSVDAQS